MIKELYTKIKSLGDFICAEELIQKVLEAAFVAGYLKGAEHTKGSYIDKIAQLKTDFEKVKYLL